MTYQIPADALDRYDIMLSEGRIIPAAWTREEDGRHLACVLAALSPDVAERKTADACPGDWMPGWLAYRIIQVDDEGSAEVRAVSLRRLSPILRGLSRIPAADLDPMGLLDCRDRARPVALALAVVTVDEWGVRDACAEVLRLLEYGGSTEEWAAAWAAADAAAMAAAWSAAAKAAARAATLEWGVRDACAEVLRLLEYGGSTEEWAAAWAAADAAAMAAAWSAAAKAAARAATLGAAGAARVAAGAARVAAGAARVAAAVRAATLAAADAAALAAWDTLNAALLTDLEAAIAGRDLEPFPGTDTVSPSRGEETR
jgi:hypothetical protein